MKSPVYVVLIFGILVLLAFQTKTSSNHSPGSILPSPSLYDTIVALDAKWEDAYDNCKLDVMEELIDEDLEFYHDRGGLMTSKKQLIDAVRNNICGKVTRELKSGSIEVSEVPGYGAVEIGQHGFRNSQEPDAKIHYSRFVHIWKKNNGKWTITRVISLH